MLNRVLFTTIMFISALLLGCMSQPDPQPQNMSGGATGDLVLSRRTLTTQGGRLDWCASNNLIAFDRMTSASSSEVFIIQPDGKGERCITCNVQGLPKGIRGQPAWHPSGEFLVIQAQGKYYRGSRFEFVSWGIHNDLWLVSADGRWAQSLLEADYLGANLHPHFSDSGDRLFWSVRRSTRTNIRQGRIHRTPGEENPWDGWHLAVADFKRDMAGKAKLTDQISLYCEEGGFFESHALRDDSIWFSHTKNGRPFVDDIYRAKYDGTQRVNITKSPGTWEEHGEPSPGGSLITFNSSRGFRWENPPDTAGTLRLELWALHSGTGRRFQLTGYNRNVRGLGRVLTSDYAWGPRGRSVAVYYAIFQQGRVTQKIDILLLDGTY